MRKENAMSHEGAGRRQDMGHLRELTVISDALERYARDLVDRARPIGPSDRILDLGCGTGIVACVLRERLGGAMYVVGVDANPVMLEKARLLAPEIDWREGDLSTLPFAADSFDLVFCQDVLRFVPDHAKALHEVRRVLSPGGRLLASTWRPIDDPPFENAGSSLVEQRARITKGTSWSLGATALSTALTEAGFVDIRIETVHVPERIAHVALAHAPKAT